MTDNQKNNYVFAVCGADKHIHRLNYSLQFLKHFSKNDITVITDTSRNSISILHDRVIDVATPKHYNNKQASIYLKTGAYKFLDLKVKNYCYLDADILAVREGVDDIFNYYTSPITFCSDHCTLQYFSPNAVWGDLHDEIIAKKKYLEETIKKHERIEEKYMARMYEAYGVNSRSVKYPAIEPTKIKVIEFQEVKPLSENEKRLNRLLKYHGRYTIESTIRRFSRLLTWFQNRTADSEDTPKKKAWITFTSKWAGKILSKGRAFETSNIGKGFKKYFGNTIPEELSPTLKDLSWWDDIFEVNGFSFDMASRAWRDDENKIMFQSATLQQAKEIKVKHNKEVLTHEFVLDNNTNEWYDRDGVYIFDDNYVIDSVEIETGYSYFKDKGIWKDEEGNIIKRNECKSLINLINKTFGVKVKQYDWQHWNGGAFLFNKDSVPFLENWHNWTIHIFENKGWRHRDQGTLVATAWKFGLQNHPTLPKVYNFITDFYTQNVDYNGDLTFTINPKRTIIKPHLMHVYHHFGDHSWNIWNDLEKVLHLTYTAENSSY